MAFEVHFSIYNLIEYYGNGLQGKMYSESKCLFKFTATIDDTRFTDKKILARTRLQGSYDFLRILIYTAAVSYEKQINGVSHYWRNELTLRVSSANQYHSLYGLHQLHIK